MTSCVSPCWPNGIRFLVLGLVGPLSCNEWTVSGSRRRDSGHRQQKHVESWVSEVLGPLIWLCGRPPGSNATKLTFGQELGVCHVRETLQTRGLPPCSVVSARRELHIARPIYDLQPAVLYTEGSVAVPCDAVEDDFRSVLTGKTRRVGSLAGITFCVVISRRRAMCPHFHPRLKSSQRLYFGFLMQMV